MNAPLRLYLVRHGQTEWSLSGQHTGVTDIPLTSAGEDEARRLGARLEGIVFTKVLTSPRQRAQRTCTLTKLTPPAVIDNDLAEWNYGSYEGQRSADIKTHRANWNVFRDGCPDGETPEQITARADRLIAQLRELRGNVALFTHGQFGAALGVRWIGLPLVEAEHFPLSTASLSLLGYAWHHPDVPVLTMWNEGVHVLP